MNVDLSKIIQEILENILLSEAIDTEDVDENIKNSVKRALIFARLDEENTFLDDITLPVGINLVYRGTDTADGWNTTTDSSGNLVFTNRDGSGKNVTFDSTGVKFDNDYLGDGSMTPEQEALLNGACQKTGFTMVGDINLGAYQKVIYKGIDPNKGWEVTTNSSGHLVYANLDESGKDVVFDSTGIKYNGVYLGGGGSGDMTKAAYDADDSGVVDNSEKLGGVLPGGYFLSTGGEITGDTTIDGDMSVDGQFMMEYGATRTVSFLSSSSTGYNHLWYMGADTTETPSLYIGWRELSNNDIFEFSSDALKINNKKVVVEDAYANDTIGGTIKIKVVGTDTYITTDGSTPGA